MNATLRILAAFVKKHSKGAAVIEAAFSLPIILLLIFFILESILINQIQAALEAIAIECTFDFITSKNTENFQTIIKKHFNKELSIGRANNVHWYFVVYKDVATMCSTGSKGGEDIIYDGLRIKLTGDDVTHSGNLTVNATKPEDSFDSSNTDESLKTLSGKAFMLTFIYEYKFTNAFVSKFFSGGSNTGKTDKNGKTVSGDKFLLWSRGFGVCN